MEIHIGDRVADVTLVSKEGNKVQFMIDGKPYDVDIVMAENGSCSILHDGNSFNAELIRGEGGKSYDVNMFYRSYHVDIVDTQTKYLRMKKGGDAISVCALSSFLKPFSLYKSGDSKYLEPSIAFHSAVIRHSSSPSG